MEKDWKFSHAGFVVEDIDKATAIYKTLGFVQTAPSTERTYDNGRYKLYNKPLSIKNKVKIKEACLQRGAFNLQVAEPVEGKSLQQEFLEKHGQGIFLICYTADNLEQEQAKLIKNGFPVIQSVKNTDGSLLETYHDTRKIGNVIIALSREVPANTSNKVIKDDWTFEKYDHLAFIVKDMDKAVKHFEAIGMKVISQDEAVWGGDAMKYRGKAMPLTPLKLYILEKGALTVELFQVSAGENLWHEHLTKHGEGIHHVHFSVDDLDTETNKLVKKGFPVTFSITWGEKGLVEAFFEPLGNLSVALFRHKGIPVRFKGLLG